VDDLITEHINKIFGVAVGGGADWGITNKVDNVHAGLSVTFLDSQYFDNFVNINRVCDLVSSWAAAQVPVEPSVHWFVDPSSNLYMKEMDADHSDGNWDQYWGGTEAVDPGTQASSTITVARDMILYGFKKNVEEYANHIVLSSKLRLPSEDYWTEDNGGAALWGVDNAVVSNSATHIVGSHSLLIEPTDNVLDAEAYYPAGENAGWDITHAGSEKTVPCLSFYIRKNASVTFANLALFTTDHDNDYFYLNGIDALMGANNVFEHYLYPIGPYANLVDEHRDVWGEAGAPDWTDINGIEFTINSATTQSDLYVDDLHISGVVVREAKDAAEIAANKTHMRFIRNDTAVNDTLTEGTPGTTDTGTAARLAYAELLRRSQTPIVGIIQIPLAVDILPGQKVHIHACLKKGYKLTDTGAFRIDKDFRVKEIKHVIGGAARYNGFETQLNLTDDVHNTHAFGAPTAYSLLKQHAGALGHSEARNLKGAAIDNLIPRLSESY